MQRLRNEIIPAFGIRENQFNRHKKEKRDLSLTCFIFLNFRGNIAGGNQIFLSIYFILILIYFVTPQTVIVTSLLFFSIFYIQNYIFVTHVKSGVAHPRHRLLHKFVRYAYNLF